MTEQLKGFKAALERSGQPFMSVAPPQPGCAHIQFTGLFQGSEVIWDATVMTLRHHFSVKQEVKGKAGEHTDKSQFIEIGDEKHGVRKLAVGLEVAQIDRPVLLKTIIMIRNYKQLRYGRHKYGKSAT